MKSIFNKDTDGVGPDGAMRRPQNEGQKTIEKYHPLITIEVGDISVEIVTKSKELIEYLIGKNYQPYNYVDGDSKMHSVRSESYRYDNLLFAPNRDRL